jgi:hypothetical protein
MTGPAVAGLHALGRIEDAWQFVPDAIEPALTAGARPIRPGRPTIADFRGVDELLADERAERADNAAHGYGYLRATRAPANLGPLDAAEFALATVETTAWQVKSALRGDDHIPHLGVAHPADTVRLLSAVDVLVTALPLVEREQLDQYVPPLVRAADQLVDAVNADELWLPVPADCAACGTRSLEASLWWPDDRTHLVRCTECYCEGEGYCPCEAPGKLGDDHIWPLRLVYELRPWPIKADRRIERRLTANRNRRKATA